jgi:hypothetical protein
MSFELYLKFTGLCAFAPNTPEKVVLSDSRDYQMGGIAMPHVAAIVIPLVNLLDTQRTDGTLITSGQYEGNKMMYFELEEEELNIMPEGTSAKPGLSYPRQGDCPDLTKDVHDFGWIAKMQSFGAGTMLKAAFSGALNQGLALARFKLPSGSEPYTEMPSLLNDSTAIVKWSFPPSAVAEQALAEVITVHRQIPTQASATYDKVVVQSSRPNRDFVITPWEGSAPVWIVNMMPDDIEQDNTVHTPTRDPDEHFSEFFDKLALNPPGAVTPTPDPNTNCGPPPGSGQAFTPKCPPALFYDVEP